MKFKRILKLILAFFPTRLPSSGVTEMEAWVKDIIETFGLIDNDSHRQAIYSMLLNLGPTVVFKPKYYFAASIMKASTNQVAYNLIMEIRDRAGKNEKAKQESNSEVG